MTGRTLVVNADDFGLSTGTNGGIIRAHEHGIVTSASLMVHAPAAAEAADYARAKEDLSLGLHLDLGEWVYSEGRWTARYERGPAEEEVPRQVELFRKLVGRDPTHLDSHQHVHREEPVRGLVSNLAAELDVPLRGEGEVRYCGDFYGQMGTGEPLPDSITPKALIGLIERLPAGTTELACHPGLDSDLRSPYCHERMYEVESLCEPSVKDAIERAGVALVGFTELG